MHEIIWRLADDTLDTDDAVRPIFEQIAAVDFFEPSVYDLNQKQQWRDFDLDRTVVDALTQRTQLVRLRGAGAREMAMVAMGKHGEEPTVVIRVPAARGVDALTDGWPALFETLSLRMTIVTSPDWRDAVEEAGIEWDEDRLPVATACGWPAADRPTWLDDLETGVPISVDVGDICASLMLAPNGELEDDAHRDRLETVACP